MPPEPDHAQPKQGKMRQLFLSLFRAFGGRLGVILIITTLGATAALFIERSHLSGLGSFGYLGEAIIAFLGNAPVIPAFPWLLLVAPMGGLYPTWGLVLIGAVAAGLGETVPYFLANTLYKAHSGNPWITRLSSLPKWARFLAVFGISLSPVFSFPGLASGILRVPLWMMIAMKVATEGFKLWLVLEVVTLAHRLLVG
jgi:membrane protein YqaA with SNARE-associated domain